LKPQSARRRKGKTLDRGQARKKFEADHEAAADAAQRIYGFRRGKAQKSVNCAGGRQQREQKGVKPYGEISQHAQTDGHRQMSKILKNG
jgi:hypothetical protein